MRTPATQLQLDPGKLLSHLSYSHVKYALAGLGNRFFVSRYQLELPKKEEIERFLEAELKEREALVSGKRTGD